MKTFTNITSKLAVVFLLLIFQGCKSKQDVAPLIDTDPITETAYNQGTRDFDDLYFDVNRNLNQDPIKIHITNNLRGLLTSNTTSTSPGLILHYGLSPTFDSVQYILSPGTQATDQKVSSGSFQNETYLLLHGNRGDGYDTISKTEFCKSIKRYEKNMKIKIGTGTQDVNKVGNHPYSVYHQGNELNNFMNQNSSQNPTYLYLYHGAANLDQLGDFLVPFVRLGNNDRSFEIDNNPSYPEGDYFKKALDAGHVCPPHCNLQQSPIKTCP